MPGMHSRGCRRVCPHTIRSCWQLGAQEALERPHPMIARTLVCALVDRATGICAVSLDMQGSLSLRDPVQGWGKLQQYLCQDL